MAGSPVPQPAPLRTGRRNHTGKAAGITQRRALRWAAQSARPARETGPGPPGLAVLRVRSGPPDRARMR